MKSINIITKRLGIALSFNRKPVQLIIAAALVITGIQTSATAQDTAKFSRPSWWFGAAAGVNGNFYNGSTQMLNADVTAPVAFKSGNGVGLYVAADVEYHKPQSIWGFILQAGYDGRNGTFKEVFSPCNCPRDLNTNLSYITVEPSLRIAPFKSDFYLFAGPRIAYNFNKAFTFEEKPNPDYPDQIVPPVAKGDFSDVKPVLVSMQVGMGYDFQLSSQMHKTQFVLSPFISFHPYFGQDPRTIETWNVTTLRAGIALKFGCGELMNKKVVALPPKHKEIPTKEIVLEERKVVFRVDVPKNIPETRKVHEVFPLRNYVYFNIGSSEIPSRYVLLRKDQVNEFNEDQVALYTPKDLSGRSPRQMTIYYNVLNILGNRMQKNPSSKITLTGSSEEGPADGKAMAQKIKDYLVNVFGISDSRIRIEGRTKPKIPSGQPGGTQQLDLLSQGNRRVSIESNSPALLLEFQSGPDAPLKPVEFDETQEAPIESYITFNGGEGIDSFASWSFEIKNEKGQTKNFGPYTNQSVSIPGKVIMGNRPEGDYKVTVTGTTKNGKIVENDTMVHLVLWKPPVNQEVTRFSIIYEFDNSKAISMYEKYLSDIVTPKIPKNGSVIIHGYTDIIGEPAYNQKLSLERSNDVKAIMEKALMKEGRTDVTFQTYGFGEDQNLAPFKNDFPEERAYNRTVIIDIIPAK